VTVPPGVSAKILAVTVTTGNVKIGVKGNPPYLDHDLSAPVKTDECYWTLEDGQLAIQMQKLHKEGPPLYASGPYSQRNVSTFVEGDNLSG